MIASHLFSLIPQAEARMISGDKRYWLALNATNRFTTYHLQQLAKHFATLEEVFSASLHSLSHAGLNKSQAQAIKTFNFKSIQQDLNWLDRDGQQIINLNDSLYPALLKEIDDPPLLLYVLGNAQLLEKPQIAIVGSRKATPAGIENAYFFANSLAKIGFVITSGMALGIDTASHQGALALGNSIAVLGTGINRIYPRSNEKLYRKLSEQGTLISELPLNSPPKRLHFPKRNRIISGLCLGTLVIEATLHSGSLITARLANEQGREVFALPGSIHNPQAKGCHQLLKQGAVLTESLDDIMNELSAYLDINQSELTLYNNTAQAASFTTNSHGNDQKKIKNDALPTKSVKEKLDFTDLDEDHSRLLLSIGYEPTPVEVIISRSGFTAQSVSVMLLNMEINKIVKFIDGGYCRVK